MQAQAVMCWLAFMIMTPAGAMAGVGFPQEPSTKPILQEAQARRSCKQVADCEEAVRIWCDGYRRADGDGDGIPCENVCRSLEEVNAIRQAIDC